MEVGEEKLFQRRPLKPENEIRLIKFLPDKHSLVVRGQFIHDSLDNPEIRYKAISYCWGTEPPNQKFWASQGHYLLVTASLHSVLQVLRSEGEQHLYWIDALCIDQSTGAEAERNHQIRLMRNIYATAQEVLAFIGEPSEDSDIAMDFIERLSMSIKALNLMRGTGLLDEFPPHVNMNMQTLVETDLTRYPSNEWTALKRLLLRPWFQRSWCVQEVVVAQKVILKCGTKFAKWKKLAYAISLLLPSGLSYLSSIDTNGYLQLEGCLNLQTAFVLRGLPESKLPIGLQNCLLLANEFSATIPHDKIFSMLGLACDATDPALDPGYEVTAQELYAHVTRYLFRRDQCFDLLHLAGTGYPRALHGLPSWVPDFHHRRRSTILGTRDGYANKVASIARFECPTEMIVQGWDVDDVQEVRELMPEIRRSSDRALSKQSRADMLVWLDASKNWATTLVYGTQRDLEIKFWRTLLCGMPVAPSFSGPFAGKGGSPEEYPELFEGLIKFLRFTVDLPMPLDVEAASMSALFEESDPLVKVLRECRGRRMFRTQTGYLGLGPAGLALKDKVVIVEGTTTPFLFRKTERKAIKGGTRGTLVGECYVDGVMKDNDEGRKRGVKQALVLL